MLPLAGLTSLGSLFTAATGSGQGTAPAVVPGETLSSGISGATSFSKGGITVTKSDNMTAIVIAGVAVVFLIVFMKRGR